jgi:uncharacterized protein (DUF342 family)
VVACINNEKTSLSSVERKRLGSFRYGGTRYAGGMATMFTQQSTEYIQQIEAEIERLQQLRNQVQATIQSEEQLESEEPSVPRKRATKKSAGKKAAGKKVAAKKRGRPRAEPAE